jgi:hypothetical protein
VELDIDVPEATIELAERIVRLFEDRRVAWDQQQGKRDAAATKKASRLAKARDRLQARSPAGALKLSTTDADLSRLESLALESSFTDSTGFSAAAATPTTGTGASLSQDDREESEKIAQELEMEAEKEGKLDVDDPVRTRALFEVLTC